MIAGQCMEKYPNQFWHLYETILPEIMGIKIPSTSKADSVFRALKRDLDNPRMWKHAQDKMLCEP